MSPKNFGRLRLHNERYANYQSYELYLNRMVNCQNQVGLENFLYFSTFVRCLLGNLSFISLNVSSDKNVI